MPPNRAACHRQPLARGQDITIIFSSGLTLGEKEDIGDSV